MITEEQIQKLCLLIILAVLGFHVMSETKTLQGLNTNESPPIHTATNKHKNTLSTLPIPQWFGKHSNAIISASAHYFLKGIMLGNPKDSHALILTPQGEAKPFHIGEQLSGGERIHAIHQNEVILEKEGHYSQITLFKQENVL